MVHRSEGFGFRQDYQVRRKEKQSKIMTYGYERIHLHQERGLPVDCFLPRVQHFAQLENEEAEEVDVRVAAPFALWRQVRKLL
jgi:hypothetical protein